MSIEESARGAMRSFVLTKQNRCGAAEGPYDLAPQLDVMTPRGRVLAIVPDRDGIAPAVDLIAREYGPASEVIFLADAYGRSIPAGQPEPERGALADAFGAGDMTVTEMLTLSAIEIKSGEMVVLQVPYTYDDVGMPVFGEVKTVTGDFDGAVIDALRGLTR